MKFCTAINCMDGRTQIPVIEFLKKRFKVKYVDMISEPGPNRILAEQKNSSVIASIFSRIKISIERHGSVGIAVVGHYDCAGNPADKQVQYEHTKTAIDVIRKHYDKIPVIGLWVDKNWKVREVS